MGISYDGFFVFTGSKYKKIYPDFLSGYIFIYLYIILPACVNKLPDRIALTVLIRCVLYAVRRIFGRPVCKTVVVLCCKNSIFTACFLNSLYPLLTVYFFRIEAFRHHFTFSSVPISMSFVKCSYSVMKKAPYSQSINSFCFFVGFKFTILFLLIVYISYF